MCWDSRSNLGRASTIMEFSKESGAAQLGGYFGSSRLDCSADLIKATASIRSCKSRFKCCYSVAVYLEPPAGQTLGT
jgi:hypothetical protein